jgi:hypothetical protein
MLTTVLLVGAVVGSAVASSVDPPLQCSLRIIANGRVAASVRNAASRVIEGEVYTHLILEPSSADSESNRNYNSFWAPIGLATGHPRGANQPERLALQPGQVLKVEAAPDKVFWDRRISSQWPDRLLGDCVPDGLYYLLLEIEGPGRNQRTVSHRQSVTVDKGVMRLVLERQ